MAGNSCPSEPAPTHIAEKGIPPIDQLPEDILHEIFMLCLPTPRHRASLSPAESPVLLTHVCQHWRESARSRPSLWSSLDVEVLLPLSESGESKQTSEPQQREFSLIVERLSSWFALTGDHPFTFQFAFDADEISKQQSLRRFHERLLLGELPKYFDLAPCVPPGLTYRLLIPVLTNLTNLTLRNVPLLELQQLTRGSFPMLERLGLSLLVGDELKDVDIDPSIPPLYAFIDSPHLRCVAAKHLPPADHLQLPWAQLTHFVEFKCHPDPTWHFLYTHIHSITSLRHLHISLDQFHARHSCNIPGWQAGRSTLPFAPVFLPELRKLSVYCPRSYCSTMKPDFWLRFDFPNLEALQIVGYNLNMGEVSSSWDSSEVEAFKRKFQGWTHLTHLSLQNVGYVPVDTFIVLLSAIPHLTVLDFEAHGEHLSLLTHGVSDPEMHLVPGLRHLILQFNDDAIDGNEWTWGVLDFAELRLQARRSQDSSTMNGGLQKVTVYSSYPTSQHVLDAAEGVSEGNTDAMRVEVEVRQRRTDLYAGWQSWSDTDEDLSEWPGLEDIAVQVSF